MSKQQWISFQLASEQYVHPIDQIKEVIPYSSPVPVPGAPPFTEGILNVRGEVITVISGRQLLGLPEPQGLDEGRILIIEGKLERLGISVDRVGSIVHFDQRETQALDGENAHITATIQIGDQLYIVADFSSIPSQP